MNSTLKYGWKNDDEWLVWQFPALFGVCWMIISNNLVMSFTLSRTPNKHIIYSMIIEKQYKLMHHNNIIDKIEPP